MFFRTLSILLATLLISQVIPANLVVSAAPVAPQIPNATSVPDESQEPVIHQKEDTTLRDATTKHFRNKDGSYSAMTYPQPVHFQDPNGDWQEIDNTLVDTGASYVPKANGFNVSLPKKLDQSSLMTMFDAGIGLAVGVPGASSESQALNTELQQELSQTEGLQSQVLDSSIEKIDMEAISSVNMTKVKNQQSVVYYPNAFLGADLECSLQSDKLKENVIVHEKQDEYVYKFSVSLKNLVPVVRSDGSIQLNNAETGQPQYLIEAPYAEDANGAVTEDALTLTLVGNTLTLTADPKWMNAKERAFPVSLDPTYSKIYDAYDIMDAVVSKNHGIWSEVKSEAQKKYKVGVTGKGDVYRSYLQFDLPSLPGDAMITNAQLMLDDNTNLSSGLERWVKLVMLMNTHLVDGTKTPEDIQKEFESYLRDYYSPRENAEAIIAHKVPTAWGFWNDKKIMSWNSQPIKDGEDVEVLCVGEPNKERLDSYAFDITDAAKEWLNKGDNENFGIMLRAADEGNTNNNYAEFASLQLNWIPKIPFPTEIAYPLDSQLGVIISNVIAFVFPVDASALFDALRMLPFPIAWNFFYLPILLVNPFEMEPVLSVNYLCTTGLEDYWSYESVPMGRSGAAYVNHYSGSMTYVHPDATLAGERMPVTLAHTYVSNHDNNNGSNYNMKLGVGFRLNLFEEILPKNKLSDWNQAFGDISKWLKEQVGITDYQLPYPEASYTLIDGDGTPHEFIYKKDLATNNEERYVSETNEKIYLKEETKKLVMYDEFGNTKTYTEHELAKKTFHYLTQLKDINGNETNITYHDGRITEVTDTVGRKILLGYTAGYLTSITDTSTGRITQYAYDEALDILKTITYFDNTAEKPKVTELSYSLYRDRNDDLWHRTQLAVVSTPDNHQYGFKYGRVDTTARTGYKVTEIMHGIGGSIRTLEYEAPTKFEEALAKVEGFFKSILYWINKNIVYQILKFFVPDIRFNEATGWFYFPNKKGDDPEHGDNDEIIPIFEDEAALDIETLTFDYAADGSVPQTTVKNSLQKDTAITYVFDRVGRAVGARDESTGNSAFIGYTENSGVKNLPGYSAGVTSVQNLLKNPSFETSGGWSGGEDYVGAEAYTGNHARKIISGKTLKPQDAPTIVSGETYTVSLFAKAAMNNAKAKLAFGSDSTDLELTQEWERYTATFDAKSNSVEIAITAINSDIFVDAIQLEKNGGASSFNLVANSHFRDKAENWTLLSKEKDETAWKNESGGTTSNEDKDGNRSYEFSGNLKKEIALYQEIPMNAQTGEMVIFGATAKYSATNENSYVYAEFFKADGSIIEVKDLSTSDKNYVKDADKKARKAPFNHDLKNIKQTTAISYPLPENCATMKLYIHHDNQMNKIEVSNVFVFLGVGGTSYNYAGGKLASATTTSGKATYTYDGAKVKSVEIRRPSKEETPSNPYTTEKVEYTYHETYKNNVEKETVTVDGLETSYTEYNYGSYGLLVGSNVWDSSAKKSQGAARFSQEVTYTNNSNDVEKVTDGSGMWAKHTYLSAAHNIVTESTASDGSVYRYGYNEFGADSTPNACDILTSIRTTDAGTEYANEYGYVGHGTNQANSADSPVSDMLKTIKHNGTIYSFGYNRLGQVTKSAIGNQELAANTYDEKFRLSGTIYGNGASYKPGYDKKNRVIFDYYDGRNNANFQYAYGNDGTISKVKNDETQRETQVGYDLTGRLTDIHTYNIADKNIFDRTRLSYSKDGGLKELRVTSNNSLLTSTAYEYDSRNRPSKVALTSLDGSTVSYSYGELSRLIGSTHALPGGDVTTSYQYDKHGDKATSIINQMATQLPGKDFTYKYSYPRDGEAFKSTNITQIKDKYDVPLYTYAYDGIGQLTSETAPDGTITTYGYDPGGNLRKINGAERFTYGNPNWTDQLTAFDGNALTYDAIGNLTNYKDRTYTWQKASQLQSIAGPNINAQYTYDYTGLRSSKKVGNVTTDFIWVGGLLMVQKSTDGNTIAWNYDSAGKMLGFSLNGTPYFYIRNLQSDVVGIYDAAGQVVAEYTYDAWGNQLTAQVPGSVGDINPIRYRGYYYDTETGYYYCLSRYYNPEWRRWISADVYMDTEDGILSTNMYAYCQNDPVNLVDPSGNKPGDLFERPEDAAKDFAKYINKKSILNNWEYATFIYLTYKNGKRRYSYYEPRTSQEHSTVFLHPDLNNPDNHILVAGAHTHGAFRILQTFDLEVFSSNDKKWAAEQKLNFYLVTPKGRLRLYNYKTKKVTKFDFKTWHDDRSHNILGLWHKCSLCAN